ncbi:MAG: response regulator [Nitrospirae bacterium]|nr:response regulator [Nitrospirota bacterium]
MAEQVKARVLLVDDEEKFVEVLSRRLVSRGMAADSVLTGEDAVRQAGTIQYDALILDLTMPGIDGMEVLHRLKGIFPELQVIMLTGQASVSKAVVAIKEGAIDFLEKPVDIDLLVNKIIEARDRRMLLLDRKNEEKMRDILEKSTW